LVLEAKVYEIVNYDELYKPTNTKGGELKHAYFVKLPVKPRGRGLKALLKEKQGLSVFGIWCLLLEAATELAPGKRGKLLNHKDEPATVEEIAEAISLDQRTKDVTHALEVLACLGWIRKIPTPPSEDTPSAPSPTPKGTPSVPSTEAVRTPSVPSTEAVRTPSEKSSPKISKDKLSKDNNNIYTVFDFWNSFKGQGNWKSHRELSPEITEAIKNRLKTYSADQLNAAIRNYADILLCKCFVWSKNWTLREFLTRHRPDDRNELQLYRFLDNNFDAGDFERTSVGKGRVGKDRPSVRRNYSKNVKDATDEKLQELLRNDEFKWLRFLLNEEINLRGIS